MPCIPSEFYLQPELRRVRSRTSRLPGVVTAKSTIVGRMLGILQVELSDVASQDPVQFGVAVVAPGITADIGRYRSRRSARHYRHAVRPPHRRSCRRWDRWLRLGSNSSQ